MKSNPNRSLKSSNLPWLVSLVVVDIMVLAVFVFTDLIASVSLTQLTAARAAVTGILPVGVLLLSASIALMFCGTIAESRSTPTGRMPVTAARAAVS